MTDLDTAAAAIGKLRADYIRAGTGYPEPDWQYGEGYYDGYLAALEDAEDAARGVTPEAT